MTIEQWTLAKPPFYAVLGFSHLRNDHSSGAIYETLDSVCFARDLPSAHHGEPCPAAAGKGQNW
jgi:hypothetical protein